MPATLGAQRHSTVPLQVNIAASHSAGTPLMDKVRCQRTLSRSPLGGRDKRPGLHARQLAGDRLLKSNFVGTVETIAPAIDCQHLGRRVREKSNLYQHARLAVISASRIR